MSGPAETIWSGVTSVMTSWHEGKVVIEHAVAISHDSLHVIVGVLLLLGLGLVLRRPISSWRPWLWLFAAILWNETVDLWVEQWPDPGRQYGEGLKDLALTMLLPTVLTLAARVRPDLFRASPRARRGRWR
jgi:hypothetical protein